MDKLMSMGGGTINNNGNADPKDLWDRMTEEEKNARVDQLWEKARRYNNKLRFQARL
jgi:hypothetical protein